MGQTRKQPEAAVGAFDAQQAIDRLEADMAEMRGDITSLKQSTQGIEEIRSKMVTVDVLDGLMQKYLSVSSGSSVTVQHDTTGNSHSHTAVRPSHVNTQSVPVQFSAIPVPSSGPSVWGTVSGITSGIQYPGPTQLGTSAVMSDSAHCTTTRQTESQQQYVTQSNGLHVPPHFQIPPIHFPPQQNNEYTQMPPNPGIWPPATHNPYQVQIPANFNPVTGHFLPMDGQPHQYSSGFRVQQPEYDRNDRIQQVGGTSYYADATLKGPRLEIPLFAGDDPIGWLQQCEKFFDMSGTPYDQWVNIATGHFCGKANVWLKNICIPWQMVNWQQFCQMIADRFTQANAHEAVEGLKNIQQSNSVQEYIDKFEECVQLVRRDHPYLQESFLMSCFIGGLRADIKHDVSSQRPRGILEAYWYSKVYENAAAAKKAYYQSTAPRNRGQYQQTNFRLPHKQVQYQAAEKTHNNTGQNDRPMRQCWYCKEPWSREHRCKQGRTLHIMQEIDEDTVELEEAEQSPINKQTFHTAPNTPDNAPAKTELMHLSTHAVEGTAGTATFSLLVQINGHQAVALVDSGSSHTFMDHAFAIKSNCPLQSGPTKKISVAGGGHLLSTSTVSRLHYRVQGHQFSSTFHTLPLHTYDIILGIDWMYCYSPVTLDLPPRLLTVHVQGKQVTLTDHTQPPPHCILESHEMQKLMQKPVLGYVIHIHEMETPSTSVTIPIPEEIAPLLEKFKILFEESNTLPPARDCDHAINLMPGSQPPNLRPYRVPHKQKEAMEEIIKKLLQNKEIRESLSPFSSPAVMVRKRDGSWRLCIDYRLLNSITIKNKFPMPVIEDLLDELHGAKIFSKLDLRSGYHQIRMQSADIPKTAFKTHMGHYEYTVMPFGLTNAPATFQNLMNTIFKDHLRSFVLVFFDDILVFSKNMEEHLLHLNTVFSILKQHNLSVKLSKCSFATKQVEYLGHVISGEGVATKPQNIEAIQKWPTPHNVSKLRGFLGLTGYYRRFVKNYGQIARPLHELLKKDSFHWSAEQEAAFAQLKQVLTTCPVLALPDFSQPFVLETDACGTGIGAVLMQKGKPIAYYSKCLSPTAAAQSIYEKEALAILEALKKWRHYLLGNPLVIKTDQQSLRFMTTQRLTEGIQHKLLLKLLEFDYTIEYKKGKENLAADALSRRDTHCLALTVCVPEWLEDVKLSYVQDKDSSKLLTKLAKDISGSPQYTTKDGIIRHGSKIYVGASTNMRLTLLETFHQSAMGGHSGTKATYQRLKRVFCWPHMKQMVEKFVAECPVCQIIKVEHTHPAGLLKPLDPPEKPWACITLDFIEALPKSQGKEVILVVVDRLTKYAHFIPLAHPYTVEQIVTVFLDNIVKLHGCPQEIISDRDRIFTSTLYKHIFKALKITLKFSTAYHPQTDGQTERVNQCLEAYLRSTVFQEPKQWATWLPMAEWWYNTSYHSSLKMTPFEALYHYAPTLIGEPDFSADICPEARFTVQDRDAHLKQLKENLIQAQNRMKFYADKARTERNFPVGAMVYLKIQPYRQNAFGLRGSLKLRSKYYGPFKIMEKVGDLAYKLQLPEDATWEDLRFIQTTFPQFQP